MKNICLLPALYSLFFASAPAFADDEVGQNSARPSQAAIASAHPLATKAGMDVLLAGGNAFDAAVAVSSALAVVEPAGSGMGGGGFWLLHRAEDDFQIMIDGRERAPLAATRDMYLDSAGHDIPRASLDGALAAGIPGQPAALAHIAAQYGRLPLPESLAPAIRLASDGFAVDERMARLLAYRKPAMLESTSAAAVFLRKGNVPKVGAIVKQRDLANTLRVFANKGHEGFYGGEVAARLVAGVQAGDGIWTLADLKAYKVIEREPIVGHYQDFRIVAASPPSSGGVVLAQALAMLDSKGLASASSIQREHLIVEAMRRAYRDRAAHLGDPDFVKMPLGRLLSEQYLAGLASNINPRHATPSSALESVTPHNPVGEDTTHFSILDQYGNRVAATLSINLPFGSAFMPAGTGVLLNNEMDDFSSKPGQPNAYGLVHGQANSIAPGKRMLSSMTPTFVESADGVAILGTPGGSRIISMVLLSALHYMHGGSAEQMVALPRFHHQYLPDTIQHEPAAFEADIHDGLIALGHTLAERTRPYGNMQVVTWSRDDNRVDAASDPRGSGLGLTMEMAMEVTGQAN